MPSTLKLTLTQNLTLIECNFPRMQLFRYRERFLLTQPWKINKVNSFEHILVDIDLPINISLLSTTKALNRNSDLINSNENTPANDSHVTKIEE